MEWVFLSKLQQLFHLFALWLFRLQNGAAGAPYVARRAEMNEIAEMNVWKHLTSICSPEQ